MVTTASSDDSCMCSSSHGNNNNDSSVGGANSSNNNDTKNLRKTNNHAKNIRYQQHNAYKSPTFTLSLIIVVWCMFSSVTSIPGAAVYTSKLLFVGGDK